MSSHINITQRLFCVGTRNSGEGKEGEEGEEGERAGEGEEGGEEGEEEGEEEDPCSCGRKIILRISQYSSPRVGRPLQVVSQK